MEYRSIDISVQRLMSGQEICRLVYSVRSYTVDSLMENNLVAVVAGKLNKTSGDPRIQT